MITPILGIPTNFTQKLFWNKFAFKIDISSAKKRNTYTTAKEISELTALLPNDTTSYRIQNDSYRHVFYFRDVVDIEHFIASLNRKKFRINDLQFPESIEQLALLQSDHKIVFRNTWFYNFFEWRIVFKPLDIQSECDLQKWVEEYFDKEGTRYQFTLGINCILHLVDPDDILIAKLAYSNIVRKVEQAVIVVNNNNNKEDTNEARTISQTR